MPIEMKAPIRSGARTATTLAPALARVSRVSAPGPERIAETESTVPPPARLTTAMPRAARGRAGAVATRVMPSATPSAEAASTRWGPRLRSAGPATAPTSRPTPNAEPIQERDESRTPSSWENSTMITPTLDTWKLIRDSAMAVWTSGERRKRVIGVHLGSGDASSVDAPRRTGRAARAPVRLGSASRSLRHRG